MAVIGESFLADFDPDDNYYNELCNQNQCFSTLNSFQDFYNFHSDSMIDNNRLTIFCQNIRSINRNLDNLLLMFDHCKIPDIFVLTETWHNNDSPLIVPGYVIYNTVRSGRSGGFQYSLKIV